jgi:hypothetical protein
MKKSVSAKDWCCHSHIHVLWFCFISLKDLLFETPTVWNRLHHFVHIELHVIIIIRLACVFEKNAIFFLGSHLDFMRISPCITVVDFIEIGLNNYTLCGQAWLNGLRCPRSSYLRLRHCQQMRRQFLPVWTIYHVLLLGEGSNFMSFLTSGEGYTQLHM